MTTSTTIKSRDQRRSPSRELVPRKLPTRRAISSHFTGPPPPRRPAQRHPPPRVPRKPGRRSSMPARGTPPHRARPGPMRRRSGLRSRRCRRRPARGRSACAARAAPLDTQCRARGAATRTAQPSRPARAASWRGQSLLRGGAKCNRASDSPPAPSCRRHQYGPAGTRPCCAKRCYACVPGPLLREPRPPHGDQALHQLRQPHCTARCCAGQERRGRAYSTGTRLRASCGRHRRCEIVCGLREFAALRCVSR